MIDLIRAGFAVTAGLLLSVSAPRAAEAAPGEPPVIAPLSGPWPAGRGFDFARRRDKTRRSVSGVACPGDGGEPRVCLVVFDEGTEARFAAIGDGRLTPLPDRIALIPGDGELDAEAAALDGDTFYVAGSHAPFRSSCDSNPSSRFVVRFRRDPVSGRALLAPDGRPAGYAASPDLWSLMGAEAGLAPFVGDGKCLGTRPPQGRNGANIEALAAKDGRLFFGFRGPTRDGTAPVLAVDAAGLFDGGAKRTRLVRLVVGPRRGIRDMQAVAGGFLILAGPDDDSDETPPNERANWTVGFWDGQSDPSGLATPRPLARLGLSAVPRRECDRDLKPEALAVFGEGPRAYRIVILSDGMCDGGPLLFEIPR